MAMKKINRLVKQFEENVIAQTEAIKKGDSKSGNRFAKRYIQAFQELRILGDEGREALTILLKSERNDIRVMSAVFLLRYKNKEAIAVLEEASKEKSLIGFEATEALKRWWEGNWSLDPI